MPDRIRPTVTQNTDFGKETTENTAVASLTRFSRTEINLSPQIVFEVLRKMGYRFGTDSIPGRRWTDFAIKGKPSYDELAWYFDWLLNAVTPSTPGGATDARLRTYLPSSTREMSPMTGTIRQGDPHRADMCAGSFLTGLQITWDVDKVDMTGAGQARKLSTDVQMSTNEVQQVAIGGGTPTSGNFKLTVVNPETGASATTGTIAFNASAATVQSALEALSNVEVGEVVATGGALPGTPVLVEFRKRFGQQNVATMTVSDNTLDLGTPAVTTPTAGAAPSETEGVVIESAHIKIYADPAHGDLGTTALDSVFSGSIQLNNLRAPVFVVNRDYAGSMKGRVPTPVDGKFALKLEAQDEAYQFYTGADEDGNPFWYIRFEAVGEEIESGQDYMVIIDLACKLSEPPSAPADEGGVYATELTFDILHSSAWGYAVNAQVQNGVATVS